MITQESWWFQIYASIRAFSNCRMNEFHVRLEFMFIAWQILPLTNMDNMFEEIDAKTFNIFRTNSFLASVFNAETNFEFRFHWEAQAYSKYDFRLLYAAPSTFQMKSGWNYKYNNTYISPKEARIPDSKFKKSEDFYIKFTYERISLLKSQVN